MKFVYPWLWLSPNRLLFDLQSFLSGKSATPRFWLRILFVARRLNRFRHRTKLDLVINVSIAFAQHLANLSHIKTRHPRRRMIAPLLPYNSTPRQKYFSWSATRKILVLSDSSRTTAGITTKPAINDARTRLSPAIKWYFSWLFRAYSQ